MYNTSLLLMTFDGHATPVGRLIPSTNIYTPPDEVAIVVRELE